VVTSPNRAALAYVGARAWGPPAPPAAVTINFHPDRVLADGRSVAGALLQEGVYRSQFETRISSGGLTAHPGGDRDRWEERMFGGAYQAAGVRPEDRPRYGGLNVLEQLNGACPRFGSCHLRLRAPVRDRCTFSYGDSVFAPERLGTADAFGPVLDGAGAALLARVGAQPAMGRELDEYVEAQIHGVVRLDTDVDAVVIDPAFAGTPAGDLLVAAAERHGFAAEWHPGTVLAVDAVPDDVPDTGGREPSLWQAFCAGGRARALAEEVAGDRLDAAGIGRAAVAVADDPEVLQRLKYLWLILVAYGSQP
jgi:Protein of unknown function (DUF3626)